MYDVECNKEKRDCFARGATERVESINLIIRGYTIGCDERLARIMVLTYSNTKMDSTEMQY